tara:strand:+ start:24 stop:587 length:564 start_codon:yes stop_codon:yes gene_type:complete
MNNQTLVIYDFKILYDLLSEIDRYINFNLIHINQINELKLNDQDNFLIITDKKKRDIENLMIIEKLPLEITKLIENINIKFLKKKFNQQSEINLGIYKLNINSRKISSKDKSFSLTEREINILIFLNKTKKPVKISELQTEVWGHNSKLETHTVETHIYRLRAKINKNFKDNNFILSSKQGYMISVK